MSSIVSASLVSILYAIYNTKATAILYHENIICLPREPGDVLSPVPSLAEGGDYYEYMRGIHGDFDCVAADRSNSEYEK